MKHKSEGESYIRLKLEFLQYLAGRSNCWWGYGIREEIRPRAVSEQINELLRSCGVPTRCPTKRLPESRVDDVNLTVHSTVLLGASTGPTEQPGSVTLIIEDKRIVLVG